MAGLAQPPPPTPVPESAVHAQGDDDGAPPGPDAVGAESALRRLAIDAVIMVGLILRLVTEVRPWTPRASTHRTGHPTVSRHPFRIRLSASPDHHVRPADSATAVALRLGSLYGRLGNRHADASASAAAPPVAVASLLPAAERRRTSLTSARRSSHQVSPRPGPIARVAGWAGGWAGGRAGGWAGGRADGPAA